MKFEQTQKGGGTERNPEDIYREKEFKQMLEEAISNLPEKQRVVFLMSRIDKMTYQEIAKSLEVSQKTIEKRMHGALSALRKLYTKI
jgi:RNA polymerase sigma-70 factor (ECF subfamily)